MRLPKRGEKGFTLIELLIVVAILGVLAAVVIPNVTQFFGRGQDEARRTEFHNVSLAVASMMIDNGIPEIPNPEAYTVGGTGGDLLDATTDMTAFPDLTSAAGSADKLTDPDGIPYVATTDKNGYILFGHDIYGSTNPDNAKPDVNYLNMAKTVYFYTCESDGSVRQWSAADTTNPLNEYLE